MVGPHSRLVTGMDVEAKSKRNWCGFCAVTGRWSALERTRSGCRSDAGTSEILGMRTGC